MELKQDIFGNGLKGEKIFLFTLRNDFGTVIKITNYGGIITSIEIPDKNGKRSNIVLGFDHLEDYLSDSYINNCPAFGCICGRYANRIAHGTFLLDGVNHQVTLNHGTHHLHGGKTGFDKVVWTPKSIEKPDGVGVELKYRSIHLEEGYPGNVDVTVKYILNHQNELLVEYSAVSDNETVINLTNHTYFNLTGCRENIFDHQLQLNSKRYTVADELLIPTGEIADVAKTPFDFSLSKKIGTHIGELEKGYDLNYVLDNPSLKTVSAAFLSEETTGRTVEIDTTEPGIQLYTGYFIPELTGKSGEKYGKYSGVALETQHFPDSPNHPGFPTTTLHAGEQFISKTKYRFGLL